MIFFPATIVGEEISKISEESGQEAETYTRFNIYNLGEVILDDHRSKESFMEKYRYKVESAIIRPSKIPVIDREIESH